MAVEWTMSLSRRIPARTRTWRAAWVRRSFSVYRDFVRHREEVNLKSPSTCHICHHAFQSNDQIALALIQSKGTKGRNRIICDACGQKLERSKSDGDGS